ncbi:origin of replication complex subunit 6-like [Trifolium pratense]|uniref:origin of replication complex subunit 6-like n=1 Tax=Trifolium pratense TaxID=57577 RepID=UPI001E693DB7|nr:origin of replication complex subunit 6-like [Trifolium pratense]
MSERAYIRSYNSLHNGIGVKLKLDVRELAIQFGCVRIIPYVRDGLKLKGNWVMEIPFSVIGRLWCLNYQNTKLFKLELGGAIR